MGYLGIFQKPNSVINIGNLNVKPVRWQPCRVKNCVMPCCFCMVVPSLPKERSPALQVPAAPMTWTLSVDDGTKIHQLSLGQAMQQGYNFLADGNNLIFQVAFTATGVVSYKVGERSWH